jgi:hypothetical protein
MLPVDIGRFGLGTGLGWMLSGFVAVGNPGLAAGAICCDGSAGAVAACVSVAAGLAAGIPGRGTGRGWIPPGLAIIGAPGRTGCIGC